QVGAYLDLLSAPAADGATAISVHADLLLEARPDLRAAFPAARWSDRDHLARWMWRHGLGEGETAVALLPDLPRPRPRGVVVDERRPFGVNLVGYLTGELGLGVAARRMRIALEAAGVPVASVSYDRTSSRMSSDASRSTDAPYWFNLIVITPDQLPYFVEDVGAEFLAGHHNIGLWYWETDVLTPRQLSSFAWVDEVWGATTYLCDVFAGAERVPVTHVPVPLVFDDPHATAEDRTRLGLDDRFTVLFSFDFLSVVERKNPLGLVEAYRRAFGPDDGARLILKGINGDVFPDKREELFDAAADRPDIEVWDRYLSSRDRLALVQSVDCYASLHRSEGLGLTMAEAMALGTPVVATAYSGNLDFMDEDSALLVPAREVLIGPGHLYPADGHWAEPDLDVAAAHLRALKDDPELARRLVTAGREALGRYDVDRVGDVAARRLRELGQGS
ncbi:MAG: glycosyltransferase family 4 protein, partial [Microthrixaceae bacterium]